MPNKKSRERTRDATLGSAYNCVYTILKHFSLAQNKIKINKGNGSVERSGGRAQETNGLLRGRPPRFRLLSRPCLFFKCHFAFARPLAGAPTD
jgi:hypothetical protein